MKTDWLFSINTIIHEYDWDMFDMPLYKIVVIVTLNPKNLWLNRKRLADSYTDEQYNELEPIIKELELLTYKESMYQTRLSCFKNLSKDKIAKHIASVRKTLLDNGFEEDVEFTNTMKGYFN